MVSLVEIYNIKESIIVEDLKDSGDPARGNKGKNREKEFYFVDEPTDKETGRTSSKVVYKRSFGNMVKDIEAESIDMKKLSDENPDDLIIYKLSEDLREIFNTLRTHVRKNYPDEYKKLEEEEIEENSLGGAGAGSSFNAGNSMAYMPNNAFKKRRKKD